MMGGFYATVCPKPSGFGFLRLSIHLPQTLVDKAAAEGLEPSDHLRRLRLSRPVQSAALPPLRALELSEKLDLFSSGVTFYGKSRFCPSCPRASIAVFESRSEND